MARAIAMGAAVLAASLGLSPGAWAYTACRVTWDPNGEPDLAGYRVQVDGAQVAEVTAPAADVPAARCPIGASVTVTAFDAAGNESAPSAPVVVEDTEGPLPPAGVAVELLP